MTATADQMSLNLGGCSFVMTQCHLYIYNVYIYNVYIYRDQLLPHAPSAGSQALVSVSECLHIGADR